MTTSARVLLFVLLFAVLVGQSAEAQDRYSFQISALGGVGGSFDADPDPGYGNESLQLAFSYVPYDRTLVGFRLGRMDFGGEALNELLADELEYLTVAGEYRFWEGYYDSGLYLGVGAYSLSGMGAEGPRDEDALGLVLGATGDFPLNRRWSVLIELSAHYASFDRTQTFGMGHVGIGFRF